MNSNSVICPRCGEGMMKLDEFDEYLVCNECGYSCIYTMYEEEIQELREGDICPVCSDGELEEDENEILVCNLCGHEFLSFGMNYIDENDSEEYYFEDIEGYASEEVYDNEGDY